VTHLFRDVLHGWGQLLLCVNVSPAARDYDETARVLRYAAVAAQVGTAARAQPPLRALRRGPPRAPHVLPGGASRGWRAGRHRRRCRAPRCALHAPCLAGWHADGASTMRKLRSSWFCAAGAVIHL